MDEHEEGATPGPQVVPIFPLPDVWLSPLTLLPLHIFEPRYRQMIEDLLDGPGRLVMGTVVAGQDGATVPDVYPLAGLGEIGRHEKLDDGRFLVWVLGLQRVKVVEVESEHPYRLVEAEPVREVLPPEDEAAPLTESLRTALAEVIEEIPPQQRPPEKLLETLTVGALADVVCSRLDLARDRRQEIFATLDAAARARMVLAEYAQMKLSDEGADE